MAQQSAVFIEGPAGKLEVVLEAADKDAPLVDGEYCAILCHPHPLYGGTMDNKVVTTMARVYRELGVPVTRFNFRGVGGSGGQHDNANGEVDDLRAVALWLGGQYPRARILICGYSFGSVVAAAGCVSVGASHLVLIAPPVARYAIGSDGCFPCPTVIVLGADDELVDPTDAGNWAAQLTSPTTIITVPGASHFFHGQLVVLRELLSPLLLEALPRG